MEPKIQKMFCKMEPMPCMIKEQGIDESYMEHLMSYFIYRYFMKSCEDNNLIDKVKFAILSLSLIHISGLRISKKIQDYIEKQGGISQRMCDFTRHVQKDMNCITKDTECVIVLGGDGTMLHAARLIVDHDIPMVGVNLGTCLLYTSIFDNIVTP